jgi:multidrug efflux pump subunit AcrB
MFFPPNEREIVTVEFWQPYGTDIRTTAERAARLDRFLRRQDEVSSTGMFIGYGGPRWYLAMEPEQTNKNYVFLVVNTRTVDGAWTLKTRIEDELAGSFPDCRASVRLLERGPPVGAPIQIRLSGEDIETINDLRARVAQAVKDAPGTTTVWDDWGEPTKKLVVEVNQEKAKRAGLSTREIALSLQAQFSGMEISQYREEADIIPIMVRSRKDFREDLWKIEGLNVYSYSTRQTVPLLQVASPRITWQPSNIRRRNGVRTMTIKSEIAPGTFASQILNGDIAPDLRRMQASGDWPQGYEIEYGGEFEESSRANASILINIPLVVGLVALILVLQFNSFRRVLIIGLTVPPMFVGVTGGMLATSSPFGFMALLGMISLVGIIVNNAILMIDQIEIERSRDQTLQDALVNAAQKRLRPIVMTAATTILGLVPLSLQGGELWRPMANVLISGLAFSTLLTLVLCPVLYSILFRIPFQGYTWVSPDSGSR